MALRLVGTYDESMAFKDGLRRAMDKAGVTQDDVAAHMGVTRPAVGQWLKPGGTQPVGSRIQRLADFLGVSVQSLFGSADEGDHNLVPVVGYVGGGEEVYPIDDDALGTGLEHVPAPPGSDDTLVAVVVRGSSMIPAFWEGDLLYYTRSAGFDRSECLYRECIVKLVDGRTFIKHIMPGSSPQVFTLMSFNAPAIIDIEIEWAAPVQFHDMRRRKVRTEMKALVKPKSARRKAAR